MPKRSRFVVVGILLIAAAVFSFSNRRNTTSVSNQIVVTAVGIAQKGDEVLLSVQAVDALKTSASLSEQSNPATGLYEAKAPSVSAALQQFLNESGRSTYILHNKLIAIGEEVVNNGSLYDTLDFFLRNMECHALVDVVVCRGDPQSLLTIQSENDAIEAEYVARMLDEGARLGMAIPSRLLDVQQTASGEYDVAIPILRVENGTPRLDGTALFRNGYKVGELSVEETTALLYAGNAIRSCMHTLDGITFRVSSVSTTLSFERDGSCSAHIRGKAEVRESHQGLTEQEKEAAVAQLERELSRRVSTVLETMARDYDSDPLALKRQAACLQRSFLPQEAHFLVKVDIQLKKSSLIQ